MAGKLSVEDEMVSTEHLWRAEETMATPAPTAEPTPTVEPTPMIEAISQNVTKIFCDEMPS